MVSIYYKGFVLLLKGYSKSLPGFINYYWGQEISRSDMIDIPGSSIEIKENTNRYDIYMHIRNKHYNSCPVNFHGKARLSKSPVFACPFCCVPAFVLLYFERSEKDLCRGKRMGE
jgi:hypothetical protein